MSRVACGLTLAICLWGATLASAAEISGDYLEMRTCDIYTGPCFANAEVGLTGRQALMAWSIDRGTHQGVDLTGLRVAMAISASDTLGYGGGMVVNPDPIKSVIMVDNRATAAQHQALVEFAKQHAGRVAGEVTRVESVPFAMEVDHVDMVGRLKVGTLAEMLTRPMAKGDCVCTNETIFYPPLTKVDNFAPAYSLAARFSGKGLGVQWSSPSTRSAFLATFSY